MTLNADLSSNYSVMSSATPVPVLSVCVTFVHCVVMAKMSLEAGHISVYNCATIHPLCGLLLDISVCVVD